MSHGKKLWSHAARLGFAWRRARKDPDILGLPDGEVILDLHAEALQRLGRHLRPLSDASARVNIRRARGDVQDAVATLLPLATRTSCTLRFPGTTASLDTHGFVDLGEQNGTFDTAEEDLIPPGDIVEDAAHAYSGGELGAGCGRMLPEALMLPTVAPPTLPSPDTQGALIECMDRFDALAQALQDELALGLCLTLSPPLSPRSPPPPPPPLPPPTPSPPSLPSSRRASRASRRHARNFQNASRRDVRGSSQPHFERDRAYLAAEAAYEQAVARGEYASDFVGWLAWEAEHAHEFPSDPFASQDDDDLFDASFLWQDDGSDVGSD